MSNRSDEHDTSNVVEDGPVMRSVAIMSPQAMAPLDSFQRLSVQNSKPLLQQHHEYSKLSIAQSNNKTVKSEVPVESTPWRVVKALPLPSNYLLDRSHVKISDVSTLEISKRIADYLFEQSISTTFDNEQVCKELGRSIC